MDLLAIVEDKVETKYVGGEVDKSETRVEKRTKVFLSQIRKGVSDMEVIIFSPCTR